MLNGWMLTVPVKCGMVKVVDELELEIVVNSQHYEIYLGCRNSLHSIGGKIIEDVY